MEMFDTLFERYMIRVCDENPEPSHDILHIGLLREWHYPEEFYSPIHHAISAR